MIYDDGTDTEENLRIREYITARTGKKPSQDLKPDPQLDPKPEPKPETKKLSIMVCVDGGCSGNHIANNPDAVGAWGVWFAPTRMGSKTATGEIKKNGLLSKAIMAYDKTKDQPVETGEWTRATNQRAELTAVVEALREMCSMDLSGVDQIIIVTDSKQYVVSWLSGRIWREYEKDKKFTKVVNKDLIILIARYLWNIGRKFKPGCSFEEVESLLSGEKPTLVIQHINSHLTKADFARLSSEYREYSVGNSHSDTLCNEILNAHK